MSNSLHPFFTEFSNFLNNIESKTSKAKSEVDLPSSIITHSGQDRIIFSEKIQTIQNELDNLSAQIEKSPTSSIIVDSTEKLLDDCENNIKRISLYLQKSVVLLLIYILILYFVIILDMELLFLLMSLCLLALYNLFRGE